MTSAAAGEEWRIASVELREAIQETNRLASDMGETYRIFKDKRSKVYAVSNGKSVAAKNAEADAATVDLAADFKLAEALWKSSLEAQRSLRASLSAWQTVKSLVKTEHELDNTGHTPQNHTGRRPSPRPYWEGEDR